MIRARALGAEEASRFFHITIQPEKEVVFTIVPLSIKKAVMQSICNRILEKSGEHGIVFSLPVDEALGAAHAPNRGCHRGSFRPALICHTLLCVRFVW